MNKLTLAYVGLFLVPALSYGLLSKATPEKVPSNIVDIWSFEQNPYKEHGPYPEKAYDNIFDVDVYLVNAVDDNTPWMARLPDGRPLEQIISEDGQQKGYRVNADLSQPSRHLDNMWFVDVEILGVSAETLAEAASYAWTDINDQILCFQQRIYFGEYDPFSVTMHTTLPGSPLIETTTERGAEGTAWASVGIDLKMRSCEDTRTILAARNPPVSAGPPAEGEDFTDFVSGNASMPLSFQAASVSDAGTLMLAALLMFLNMDSATFSDSVKHYVYDYSYSW